MRKSCLLALLAACCAFLAAPSASAQTAPDPQTAPLPEIEQYLRPIARSVLRDPDYAHKLAENNRLAETLAQVLARPESYDYPFDSLETVSRQYPADQSFRIFTWQIVNSDSAHFASTRAATLLDHTYYGFIQRKLIAPDGSEEIVVIPLEDKAEANEGGVEGIELNNKSWLGALYYKPQYSDFGVLTYDGEYAQVSSTNKLVKRPVRYYVLLGYNGNDINTNLKIIDILFFDPKDSSKAKFGAPIFTINSMVQKYRMVFRYSDNSGFSLNQRIVLTGGMFKKKKPMLVFEHLVKPKASQIPGYRDVGTDGTQDAFYWTDRVNQHRKGFFLMVPNVTVYEPSLEEYDPKELERQRKDEQRRLRRMGIEATPSMREDAARQAAQPQTRPQPQARQVPPSNAPRRPQPQH